MQTLLNPYIAGAPIVEPSMFFGRQDVFQWIERNLSGKYVDHILVIHGQRRVGKTSVLKQIPNFLPKTYIQVFFDLQGRTTTTLDRFLWWLGREIARVARQSHGLAVPAPEQEAFTSDADYLHAQFLPGLKPLLGEHKLLLTFDEFDTLEQSEIRETLGRPLIDYLRRLFELEYLNFIFSIGSSGRKLENMQASYTDFFKTALYRKISFLSKEDCQQLIARPVEGVLVYDPQAVQRIYAITGGHPYFAQLVCHELFSLCQKTGKRALSEGDVDAILDDVIERGTVNLKFTWDEASTLEKWILACLAQTEGVVSTMELSRTLQVQRVRALEPDLNAALLHLREKDVLSEGNRFVVYLLHRWLQKNRPLDRVREELVEVNPIANRYIEIGEEYHTIGQVKKAVDSFQQALAVDPQNMKAQTSIAGIYLEQTDYPAAAQAFEKALAIDDEDVSARTGVCDAYMALGEAALEGQETEQARGYFLRVLEVNWEHGEAHQRLTDIYSQQSEAALTIGDDDAALAALDEALRYTPEDEALQTRRARVTELIREKALKAVLEKSQAAASAGHWEQAIAPLKEALQATPDEPRLLEALEGVIAAGRQAQLEALRQQAQGAGDAGQWQVAAQTWRDYLALEPEDTAQAREALQRAETQAEMAQAYQEAQRALDAKDYSRAVGLLKRIVLQDETYKDGARLLALAIEGQRKRRRVFTLPKWARPSLVGPALAGVVLLAGLIFVGIRFGPSWMGALRKAETQPPATAAATGVIETPAGAPQPAWVDLFAKPALEAIQGRSPDFEDDFSSPKAEWKLGGSSGGLKIEDFISEGFLQLGPEVGSLEAPTLNATNFVISFDFLPPTEIFYKFDFSFRGTTGGYFYSLIFSERTWGLLLTYPGQQDWPALAEGKDSPEIVPGQWTHVELIVQGDQGALYLNGKPVGYVQDDTLSGDGMSFYFAEGTKILDNVKFWRLESQAQTAEMQPPWVEAFAAPVLQEIQGRSPDFEDDFSTPLAEWTTDRGQPIDALVLDGVLRVDSGGLSASALNAPDFALQFDFLPQEGEYKFGFRYRVEGDGGNYGLYFHGKGWDIFVEEAAKKLGTTLAKEDDSPEIIPSKWTRALLIVRGDEFALYLNDQPKVYFKDDKVLGERNYFGFDEGTKTLDNVKFWKLEGLGEAAETPAPTEVSAWGEHPAWMDTFTSPALEAIRGQSPDFEDDFSAPKAEWRLSGPSGELNIADYITEGAFELGDESGQLTSPSLTATDFVIEFDFLPPAAAFYKFGFRFRGEADGRDYSLYFSERTWGLLLTHPQEEWRTLAEDKDSPEIVPGQWTHVQLIVQGDQYAFFLNGKPAGYVLDDTLSGNRIGFNFAEGIKTLDNVKFWSLDPAWIKEIQNRSPDFEDDFTSQKPEWGLDDHGSKIADGFMTLVVKEKGQNAIAGGDHLDASDFVLEFDFQRSSQDCMECSLVISFRGTDQSWYNLDLSLGPGVMKWIVVKGLNDTKVELYRGDILRTDPPASHHYRLVAQGDTFWFYLDQKLVSYWQEASLTGSSIWITSMNEGGISWIQLDNLKFWSLDLGSSENKPPATATAMGAIKTPAETPQPAATPPPTQTASPAWVADFAKPILDSIRERKPSFEEDFTAPDALWHFGHWGDLYEGETSKWRLLSDYVQAGEMRVDFDPDTFYFLYRDLGANSSYAVQFDVTLGASDANTKFYLSPGKQAVTMNILPYEQWWSIGDSRDSLIYGNGYSPEIGNNKLMKVLLIAKGYEFAVFLNDVPLTHFESDKKDDFQVLEFEFKTGGSRLRVMMDNLKYWILRSS